MVELIFLSTGNIPGLDLPSKEEGNKQDSKSHMMQSKNKGGNQDKKNASKDSNEEKIGKYGVLSLTFS